MARNEYGRAARVLRVRAAPHDDDGSRIERYFPREFHRSTPRLGVAMSLDFDDPVSNGTILAGHAGGCKTGMHTMSIETVGDLYLTLAEEVMGAPIGKFPSATKKLSEIA